MRHHYEAKTKALVSEIAALKTKPMTTFGSPGGGLIGPILRNF